MNAPRHVVWVRQSDIEAARAAGRDAVPVLAHATLGPPLCVHCGHDEHFQPCTETTYRRNGFWLGRATCTCPATHTEEISAC